ncbi:putative myo-inositol transporter 1 protein [Zalerion maritima]|uniref:Myo-inositol transporter 1 protein n=1 Tax=Zalerion maritima TaxID=339359 RepID=A0AAD5RTY0_9PEZI|nr:putative myo-inositol transporter 1 protein [Zalerion maritima]
MHETGTQAGDVPEMSSVFSTPGSSRSVTKPLYVGDVKANVGHGGAAAGVTSVIKSLLMFKENSIPPRAGIKTRISPKFPSLDKAHICLARSDIPYPHSAEPTRILVNNFGATTAGFLWNSNVSPPEDVMDMSTGCDALRTESKLLGGRQYLCHVHAEIINDGSAFICGVTLLDDSGVAALGEGVKIDSLIGIVIVGAVRENTGIEVWRAYAEEMQSRKLCPSRIDTMSISANAPLIHNAEPEEDDDFQLETGSEATGGDDDAVASPSLFVWLLTLSAGISGLLFGYDTGVISATLVSTGTGLSNRVLTDLDKSLITSCTSLFALFICPFSSALADSLGRKRVIAIADVLFVLGAVVQAWSTTVFVMVVGRSIVGAAVGAASFVTPLFIAELAPSNYRGRLVTMNVLSITLGQVIAYIIGWAFAEYGDETGWRWMVGLGAVPALLQAALVFLMPETPRWLVKAGRITEAKQVIARVAGNGPHAARAADSVLKAIELEVEEEDRARRLRHRRGHPRMPLLDAWDELISVPGNRRALAIACLLQGLQQLCGFNSLMYFSATIFTMLGFRSPTLTSLVVAVTNFAFTVAALLLIDRVGRRRILLYSVPFMVIGLLLSAYGFSDMYLPETENAPNPDPSQDPGVSSTTSQGSALLILISIMIYVAAYALGLGNVPWMQSELFPLTVRSLGSGIATGTNWGSNFVIGLTFLPLMNALTPSWTFVLYAGICAVGLGFIWRIYPETAGLSLEEATGLLENGWGVR